MPLRWSWSAWRRRRLGGVALLERILPKRALALALAANDASGGAEASAVARTDPPRRRSTRRVLPPRSRRPPRTRAPPRTGPPPVACPASPPPRAACRRASAARAAAAASRGCRTARRRAARRRGGARANSTRLSCASRSRSDCAHTAASVAERSFDSVNAGGGAADEALLVVGERAVVHREPGGGRRLKARRLLVVDLGGVSVAGAGAGGWHRVPFFVTGESSRRLRHVTRRAVNDRSPCARDGRVARSVATADTAPAPTRPATTLYCACLGRLGHLATRSSSSRSQLSARILSGPRLPDRIGRYCFPSASNAPPRRRLRVLVADRVVLSHAGWRAWASQRAAGVLRRAERQAAARRDAAGERVEPLQQTRCAAPAHSTCHRAAASSSGAGSSLAPPSTRRTAPLADAFVRAGAAGARRQRARRRARWRRDARLRARALQRHSALSDGAYARGGGAGVDRGWRRQLADGDEAAEVVDLPPERRDHDGVWAAPVEWYCARLRELAGCARRACSSAPTTPTARWAEASLSLRRRSSRLAARRRRPKDRRARRVRRRAHRRRPRDAL